VEHLSSDHVSQKIVFVKHFDRNRGRLCLRVASAEIGFRVLFLVPKTDGDPFRSGYGVDEYDFVLEAVPFLRRGRISFSIVWVNSARVLGFRCIET
jgi:hypothetical protein